MPTNTPSHDPQLLQPPPQVVASFGLGIPEEIQQAGGTATLKWFVRTRRGRFVVRVRTREFAAEPAVKFDHEVLRRLSEAGLPVPLPVTNLEGRTWLRVESRVYEVLSWIEGEPFDAANPASRRNLGRFLANFHQVLGETIPPGKEGLLREDHPALLRPLLGALRQLFTSAENQQLLECVGEQLDRVEQRLDSGLYRSLPRCVIHGDLHPGNLRFRGARVAAVYDFDYLNVQARARDLSDLIMFFASTRAAPLDCDNIHSLTQPFVPDAEQAGLILQGYQETVRLTEAEWSALSLLMRSRWIQMRLRGSRKVPVAARVDFAVDPFLSVIEWLDTHADRFFTTL